MLRRAAWPAVLVATAVLAVARVPAQTGPPPLLILIGIDGFRPDYLERADTPALRRLAERGVRADGLIPPFPSKTFPSFTTIATGLHPVHHGIVSNTMDDPAIPGRFRLSDHVVRSDTRWWLGEPIWNTAERQGLRTGGLFWPGDDVEIGGRRPSEWLPYDDDFPDETRVARVLEWLARPAAGRLAFVSLYFSLVDLASHSHGPFAPGTLAAAARADALVGRLVDGLAQLGLDRAANLVLVSDHGMAETHPDRVAVLDDYVDLATVDVLDSGPLLGLRPKGPDGPTAGAIVATLRGRAPHLTVSRREDLPAVYRYGGSWRVPPVVGVADEGWQVLTRAQRDRWLKDGGGVRGEHGYAPDVRAMRGLFVASGPAFREGLRVPAFESQHLYELFCRVLGISPGTNDGDPAVTAGWLRDRGQR